MEAMLGQKYYFKIIGLTYLLKVQQTLRYRKLDAIDEFEFIKS